jgi:hypothetical protein
MRRAGTVQMGGEMHTHLLPAAKAVGAAVAAKNLFPEAQPKPPKARALMRRCLSQCTRAASSTAVWLLHELQLLVSLLLPYAFAVYGHSDIALWELWLLRPLYTLAMARALAGVLHALAMAPATTDSTPARFTLVVSGKAGRGAGAGWMTACRARAAMPWGDRARVVPVARAVCCAVLCPHSTCCLHVPTASAAAARALLSQPGPS